MQSRIPLFLLLTATFLLGQAVPPNSPSSDGLELLTRVSNRYRDAKSYSIESLEERTADSEYRRYWEKTSLVAAGLP